MKPFADDADTETFGSLTVENGGDRILVHGSLEITRDREGLTLSRRFRAILDAIVRELEAGPLPTRIAGNATRTVDEDRIANPFR